jgi:hypothetical protein
MRERNAGSRVTNLQPEGTTRPATGMLRHCG